MHILHNDWSMGHAKAATLSASLPRVRFSAPPNTVHVQFSVTINCALHNTFTSLNIGAYVEC